MAQPIDQLLGGCLERLPHGRRHEPLRLWGGLACSGVRDFEESARRWPFAIGPAVVIPIRDVKTHSIGRNRDADGSKIVLAALALAGDFLSLDDILAFFDPEAAPLAL